MANLPSCPNFREGKCERSDLLLQAETEKWYTFFCNTCELTWVWTKPHTKESARYERALEAVKKRTEEVRDQDSRPLVFGAPKGGWA